MSLRELVDAECGGANPLMRLGNHVIRDAVHKDEGISGRSAIMPPFAGQPHSGVSNEKQLVNEFFDQMSAPAPQTFHMDAILKGMHQMDAQQATQMMNSLSISSEITNGQNWAGEFKQNGGYAQGTFTEIPEHAWNNASQSMQQPPLIPNAMAATAAPATLTRDLFDANAESNVTNFASYKQPYLQNSYQLTNNVMGAAPMEVNYGENAAGTMLYDDFVTNSDQAEKQTQQNNWVEDFDEHKTKQAEKNESNKKVSLNEIMKKFGESVSEESEWLSDFNEYYDPYKEYVFDEENPFVNVPNAFEKGKEFLANGDIPNAVLCFEAAVRQDADNAEIWELLGTSQAENEKDPNAITALKKSLELNPNNLNVYMALAISYTNESLQNQALQMLLKWLQTNTKYTHLVPPDFRVPDSGNPTTSLINAPTLANVEGLFMKAVQTDPSNIDPDLQEALGVLFNLSSDFDKAADCFRLALHVRKNSAKLWNRLGASLANGCKSVEAVEAYQNALAIEPGYVRARYNVGIICINLKAYKEAIEHFLTALNHQATCIARSGLEQEVTNNQMSDAIWSTLRMATTLMGSIDLHSAIDHKDLKTLNEKFMANNE